MATKQQSGKKSGTKKSSGSGSSNGNGNGGTEMQNAVPVQINKALASLSVEEIEQGLRARREAEVATLQERLAKLQEEATSVEERIAALQGVSRSSGGGQRRSSGRRGPRARNERPLAEMIHEVLKKEGAAMGVNDIIVKLEEAGWKSNAKNKYPVVFTALNKNGDMFGKQERGQYVAK